MRTAPALAAAGLTVICALSAPDVDARSNKRNRATAPFSLTASDGTGLRIVALKAKVVVDGPLAFTELHLTFHNPENRRREGRFSITLPPTAAISRLAMKIEGRWQEGEVVERRRAHRIYETYLHQQRDPALLEKSAGNTFQARIFPIEARANKQLRISYSEELASSRRPYRLRLRGLPRIARLRVRALIHKSTQKGLRWKVRHLRRNRTRPRRDFTITLPKGVNGLRHKDLAVLRVSPRIPARFQAIRSLLVLFDSSASAGLDYSDQVTRLGRLVEALVARHGRGLRVKVAAFDQSVKTVYTGHGTGFGARHLRRLRRHGAFGASNLETALAWAARQRGYRRLLLITDGVATAGETRPRLKRVLARARGRLERVDVLPTGNDSDEDRLQALVTGVLPKGGILLDEQESPTQLAQALGQVVRTPVPVSVEGARWVWPRELDSLQPGSEALIYVKLRRRSRGARALSVSLGGYLKQRLRVRVQTTQRPLLERAWVRARIQWLSDQDYSPAHTRRIIQLSKQHRVLSESTALLVLENDAEYRAHGLHRGALANILTVGRRGLVLIKRSRHWLKRNVARPKVAPKKPAADPTRRFKWSGDFWELALGRVGKPAPATPRKRIATTIASARAQTPTVFCSHYGVSGALDAGIIRRVIRRHLKGVRHCYQTELQLKPRLEGMVKLAFTIRSNGRVGIVRLASTTLHNEVVESCVLRQARKWRFPRVAAARMPYVVYPFQFTNRALARVRARRRQRQARAPKPPPKPKLSAAYAGELLQIKRLLRSKKRKQALRVARRWRARSPESLLALVGLGEALEALGRRREAARVYGSIIDLHPARPALRRYAGNRLTALGKRGLRLALDTYKRALALRPDHAHGYRLLALTQTRLGLLDQALTTLEKGLRRRYPSGRFTGVKPVLRADLGLVARALVRRAPRRRAALARRLKRLGARIATTPTARAVLTWETDANDVDLHLGADGQAPRGALYKDVTNGFGPECAVLPTRNKRSGTPVQVRYFSRGPMGFGLGTVSVLRHDGRGTLRFEDRPFVIMKDRGTIAMRL